jgi:hypothetical protein
MWRGHNGQQYPFPNALSRAFAFAFVILLHNPRHNHYSYRDGNQCPSTGRPGYD